MAKKGYSPLFGKDENNPNLRYRSDKDDYANKEDSKRKSPNLKISSEYEPSENYQNFVESLLKHVDKESRSGAKKVLESPQLEEVYRILREDGISEKMVAPIMLQSLNKLQKKGQLSLGAYVSTIAHEIAKNESYSDALDQMREEELISERTYEQAREELEEKMEENRRHLSHSGLEKIARKVAAILLMAVGIIFALSFSFSLTGAAVGTQKTLNFFTLAGMIIFAAGVFLFPHKNSNEQ